MSTTAVTPPPASDAQLRALASEVASLCSARGWQLTLAESCTGGWIAKCCTDLAGSSAWFATGFVTYGNEAKSSLLGVPEDVLLRHGAVSEAVVRSMATGALTRAGADLAVAVSGIAGPAGGSADKPVGTVWFAWAHRRGAGAPVRAERHFYHGDREAIRRQAVATALAGLLVQ